MKETVVAVFALKPYLVHDMCSISLTPKIEPPPRPISLKVHDSHVGGFTART